MERSKLLLGQGNIVFANRQCSFWLTGILVAALGRPASGEITLSSLFTNNAVLQRDARVPVWGTTDQSDEVTVTFGEQTVTATPNDGEWHATLAPMDASITARDLLVRQGDKTVTLANILVGDIWICGGQSNMELRVKQSTGRSKAISSSANPNIRLFTVNREGNPQPQKKLKASPWQEAGPKTVADFSAVGYYFGRDLEKSIKIPIGLINSNVGSTTAERWMSQEAIDGDSELKGMRAKRGTSDLYNAMILPLAPFAIKGAIWYQGESNARWPYHYRHVLAAMIKDWRRTFGQGDFPFLIVELAPFRKIAEEPVDEEWAVVRESQQWVAKNLPNVETVSIVDVGDEKAIHPQRKQPVGARLAIAARSMVYGEKIPSSGPKYDSVTFNGGQAIVTFKNVGTGLLAKDGELKGFTLAGEDKKFHHAKARIEGNTVIVTSDAVAEPKAVRFGWANYPVINLWNKDGQPASPFRTDDWDVVRQMRK
jgi:sialate O-acetylesterase